MKALELLEKLTASAVEYRRLSQESVIRNRHMNHLENGEIIKQKHIDAVLVDFINYIGGTYCIDYALYVMDLLLKEQEAQGSDTTKMPEEQMPGQKEKIS